MSDDLSPVEQFKQGDVRDVALHCGARRHYRRRFLERTFRHHRDTRSRALSEPRPISPDEVVAGACDGADRCNCPPACATSRDDAATHSRVTCRQAMWRRSMFEALEQARVEAIARARGMVGLSEILASAHGKPRHRQQGSASGEGTHGRNAARGRSASLAREARTGAPLAAVRSSGLRSLEARSWKEKIGHALEKLQARVSGDQQSYGEAVRDILVRTSISTLAPIRVRMRWTAATRKGTTRILQPDQERGGRRALR